MFFGRCDELGIGIVTMTARGGATAIVPMRVGGRATVVPMRIAGGMVLVIPGMTVVQQML